MKLQWMYFIGIIFALIIALFAVLNVERVQVNYLFGHAEWPLILIVIGSVLIGSLITGLMSSVKMASLRKKIKILEKEKAKEDRKNNEVVEVRK